MPASRTHAIPKRDIRFDLSTVDLDAWHPAGFHVSHYFNVQSLLFPQGERFFIRSVRHFRDQVSDPRLLEQVAGFIAQEALHGREHDGYNAQLGRIGYRVEQMDRFLARSFDWAERFLSPKTRLAMTVALEHVTAIGAERVLADGRILDGAHPEMARLWRWHALEETEHKAVAFDVYREVAGTGWGAWFRRCAALLAVSISMQFTIWFALLRVTTRDRRGWSLSSWGRLLAFLWLEPGAFRRDVPAYCRFFGRGFHPWDVDNYHQVRRWAAAYTTGPAAAQDRGSTAS